MLEPDYCTVLRTFNSCIHILTRIYRTWRFARYLKDFIQGCDLTIIFSSINLTIIFSINQWIVLSIKCQNIETRGNPKESCFVRQSKTQSYLVYYKVWKTKTSHFPIWETRNGKRLAFLLKRFIDYPNSFRLILLSIDLNDSSTNRHSCRLNYTLLACRDVPLNGFTPNPDSVCVENESLFNVYIVRHAYCSAAD